MPLVTIANLLNQGIRLYQLALMLYALMTWFPNAIGTPLWKGLSKIVDPFLEIFDRYIPPIGGLSFNVIIAFFVLELAQRGVWSLVQLIR